MNEYKNQVNQHKTSGPKQSSALINYTALNARRMKRAFASYLKEMPTYQPVSTPAFHWLIITETWCGDAAQNIPPLSKLAYKYKAQLRFIYRDEHPALIDAYLTIGGRSIPKLIMLDQQFRELATWGPRPQVLQQMLNDFKSGKLAINEEELKLRMQQWYNHDQGQTLATEIDNIMAELLVQNPS